jgi:hypothetical protein
MVSTRVVEFILERIEEDEKCAMEAIDRHPIGHAWAADSDDAEYFSRWNPWRTLNVCLIRRRVLSVHKPVANRGGDVGCAACDPGAGSVSWPCETMRLLALDWVEHPDFDDRWVRRASSFGSQTHTTTDGIHGSQTKR